MEDSKKKSILKTLTYRAVLTVVLAIVTYAFTGDIFQTSGITIVFSIISTLMYYFHERMWNKIQLK
jgi:adenylylsulfate kinase